MSSIEDKDGGGGPPARRWQFDGPPPVPPGKRCTKCGSGPADGATFIRDSKKKDGLKSRCRECIAAVLSDRWRNDPEYRTRRQESHKKWREANPEKAREIAKRWETENRDRTREQARRRREADRERFRAVRRDHYRRNKEVINAKVRAKRRADPERFRRYHHVGYWRDPEESRRKTRQYRRAHREKILASKRAFHRRHSDRINARRRQDRRENPEEIRHKDRVYYWHNVERKRATHRRSHARNAQSRRVRHSIVSLDDAGVGAQGKPGRSLMERTASASAPDPQEVLLTAESQTASLAWVETALSWEERDVLTAFADSDFDAVQGAELLGMGLADFERLLAGVQRRARVEIQEA